VKQLSRRNKTALPILGSGNGLYYIASIYSGNMAEEMLSSLPKVTHGGIVSCGEAGPRDAKNCRCPHYAVFMSVHGL
jgi:hypothetical protein